MTPDDPNDWNKQKARSGMLEQPGSLTTGKAGMTGTIAAPVLYIKIDIETSSMSEFPSHQSCSAVFRWLSDGFPGVSGGFPEEKNLRMW
jgi:hypothetical protein